MEHRNKNVMNRSYFVAFGLMLFSFILIASTFSFTYIETAAIFIVNGFVVKLVVLLIIIYCLKIILDNFNRLKVK